MLKEKVPKELLMTHRELLSRALRYLNSSMNPFTYKIYINLKRLEG
jgi:hypothetical protein